MRHPYFELDLATRGTHPIGHAHRIIAANFVTPHLDNCRRQTGGIAVEGRRKGTRISAGEIMAHELRCPFDAHQRVSRGVQPELGPGQREIGLRRQCDVRGRQWKASVTQSQQQ